MSSQISLTHNNIAKQMKAIPLRRIEIAGEWKKDTRFLVKTSNFTVVSFRGDFSPAEMKFPQHVRTQFSSLKGFSIKELEEDYQKSLQPGAMPMKLNKYIFAFNMVRDCYYIESDSDMNVRHTVLPSGRSAMQPIRSWDFDFLHDLSTLAACHMVRGVKPSYIQEIANITDLSELIYHCSTERPCKFREGDLFDDANICSVVSECINISKRSKTRVLITESYLKFEQNAIYVPNSSNYVLFELPSESNLLLSINNSVALKLDGLFRFDQEDDDEGKLQSLRDFRDANGLSTQELYSLCKKLFKGV